MAIYRLNRSLIFLSTIGCHQLSIVSSFGSLIIAPSFHHRTTASLVSLRAETDSSPNNSEQAILCDLQTLLRLAQCISTGGSAKMAIQSGQCRLNGHIETRRAKKLFAGDQVQFGDNVYAVESIVHGKGYVYKPKVKKNKKPEPIVYEDGTLEFGGRYRSIEWRQARRQKKVDRNPGVAAHREELRPYLPQKEFIPRKHKPGRSYPGQKQQRPPQ